MTLKIMALDDGLNWVSKEVAYVSPEVRCMVDNLLFMSAYCHKTMFESDGTRQAFRTAFSEYSLQAAIDNNDTFYSSWKEYRKTNPVPRKVIEGSAATWAVDFDAMMGDDEHDVPLFGAAPAAAAAAAAAPAPAEGAAPAAAPAPAAAEAAVGSETD
jgi:hypothetical protein